MNVCIAVFETSYETMRSESFFRENGVRFRPVLKPRKIGSSCRMALQFPEEDLDDARAAVREGNLELSAFYRKDEEGGWVKIGAPPMGPGEE